LPGSAKPNFRDLLALHKPVHNAWLGLGSPLGVEIAADAGWHVVTIDQQHGMGGYPELTGCLTAARAAGVPALVRVATLDYGLIGRALDAGAQGVIVPMVETGADAAKAVHAVKYPPHGGRSFGPNRARLLVKGDYFANADAWTVACGQIETKQAVENIDAICATEGFDMICVGPNDLAISMSGGNDRDLRAPAVLEAIEHVRERAATRGVITAIFANDPDYASQMSESGWQVISIGTDVNWLSSIARQMLPDR
jgi:4-hydroxy-2-oxoheptanedioate aldolase